VDSPEGFEKENLIKGISDVYRQVVGGIEEVKERGK
jgi:hypothetical protein